MRGKIKKKKTKYDRHSKFTWEECLFGVWLKSHFKFKHSFSEAGILNESSNQTERKGSIPGMK